MGINKKLARILIVDDNIDEANGTYNLLKKMGYEASFVFSFKEAESAIRVTPFNIVILDCFMPGMDGPTLAQKIYSTFKSSISVVLVSGIVKKSNIKFFKIPNVHTMINKPLDSNKLDSIIKDVLKTQFYEQPQESVFSILSEKILKPEELNQKIQKLKNFTSEDLLLLFSYLFHSKSEGTLTLSKDQKFFKTYFYNGGITHFDENNYRENSIQYIKENRLLLDDEMKDISKIKSDLIIYMIKQSFLSPHHYTHFIIERVLSMLNEFSHQKGFKIEFMKSKGEFSLEQEDFSTGINFEQKKILLDDFSKPIDSFVEKNFSEKTLKEKFENFKSLQLDLTPLKEGSLQASFLKEWNSKKSHMKSIYSIKDFISLVGKSSSFYTKLYKALFYNFIELKRDSYEEQTISQFYLKRYSYLLKELESMDIDQTFELLGCKDLNDVQQVKSVHNRFIKFNHVDSHFCYSKDVKDRVLKVLQIVNQAYSVLLDKNKMEKYNKEKAHKKSLSMVKFKGFEEDFRNLLLEKNYDQLKRTIQNMESLSKELPQLELKIDLYKICLMIKEKDYLIDENVRLEFSSQLVREDQYGDIKDLFYYVRGCLEKCKGDLKEAQAFFQKAIDYNVKFNLAQIEMMDLKNKTNKSFSLFKKSS